MRNAGIAALLLFILTMPPVLFAESSAENLQRAPRFALNFGVGIGIPNMGRPMPFNQVGINRYYGEYSGNFECLVRPLRLSIGMGYEFLNPKGEGNESQPHAGPRPFFIGFPTHGVFALVDKRWQVLKNPLALEVHGTIKGGHYWSSHNYTYPEWTFTNIVGVQGTLPETQTSFHDSRWGTELVGGISWLPTKHFAFGIDGGYRWLKFHVVELAATGVSNETDYSGPTMRFRVSTRF